MASQYQVWLYNSNGVLQDVITGYSSLSYARKVNEVGSLTLEMPKMPNFIAPDSLLEVRRNIDGGEFKNDLETVWIAQKFSKTLNSGGTKIYKIEAFDALTLFNRRIVAWYANTAQSQKTAAADDMMKQIVSENCGASATDIFSNSRAIPGLVVQANKAAAPSITYGFAWRTVFRVLQDIAATAFQSGTYLAFDLVWLGGANGFEFRTYTGQRGVDLSILGGNLSQVLTVSQGMISETEFVRDYSDQNYKTFIYTGGQGDGSARLVVTSQDNQAIAQSNFGRIEDFLDGRNVADSASLTASSNAQLKASRAKITFKGKLLNNPNFQYGVHYNFGDVVLVQDELDLIACRLDSIAVKLAGSQETIDISLQSAI